MKKEVSLCWFRRDLRFNDNTALYHALKSPYPVLPVFIFDPEILDKLTDKNDKRVSLIYNTLCNLNKTCRELGSSFYLVYDQIEGAFAKLIAEFDVKAVFCNHDYEPYAIDRDRKIHAFLLNSGIEFNTYKDQVIFERSEIFKSDNTPYTVFTSYSKRWRQMYSELHPLEFPSEKYLSNFLQTPESPILLLEDMGFNKVDPGLLEPNLNALTIADYHNSRDLPSIPGTSYVSPYLRFGILSIRHLVKLALQWNETWLNELIWREFFMMILYHFPKVVNENFKKKYDNISWRNNEQEFDLWCQGKTGYPIVDAGMRQLNETGWMHNRVRMIVAGFLTKHLLIDWRWGEAYFAEKLLDYELSSNNGNWQWAAGSGCDSAPYFRIFNPTLQTLKFDPELIYIKTWIKEFNKYHLIPIVDHEFARKRALKVYKSALKEE